MKLSRRGWNNLLILALIVFMAVLNLPNVIKSHLKEKQQVSYPHLLNPEADVEQLHFAQWSLERKGSDWVINRQSQIPADELASRWISLVGTKVDEATFTQLTGTLSSANTLEVWYQDLEEPQRVTYYQTPNFWLLKNWQDEWIAVSVEDHYLFPF